MWARGSDSPAGGRGRSISRKRDDAVDYTVPNQKLVSDGQKLWYYQPEEKQVLISDVSSVLKERTPLAFLAGEEISAGISTFSI